MPLSALKIKGRCVSYYPDEFRWKDVRIALANAVLWKEGRHKFGYAAAPLPSYGLAREVFYLPHGVQVGCLWLTWPQVRALNRKLNPAPRKPGKRATMWDSSMDICAPATPEPRKPGKRAPKRPQNLVIGSCSEVSSVNSRRRYYQSHE